MRLQYIGLSFIIGSAIILYFYVQRDLSHFLNFAYPETSEILNLSNEIINSTFPQFKTNNNNNNNTNNVNVFSDQQNISNNQENNFEISLQIITSNNTINTIWDDFSPKEESSHILKRRSIDGDNTFGHVMQLSNYSEFAINDISNVYNNNMYYIVWQGNFKGQFDIFLSKSSNGGITFSQPINLSNDSGDSTNPNLITVPNNLYVISNDNSTKKYNVMIKRSSDGGITFSQPINLSNTTNSNSINLQLAATANELFVVWQEDLSGNNQIYFTKVNTL
jgi:hypothetical protein